VRLCDEQVEEKELDENRVKEALQELLESDKEAKEARRQRYAKTPHQHRFPVQCPCSAHLTP